MKKYLLLIIAIFVSYSLSAQCLGEDCSIRGRNKAAKKKEARMTGKRSGSGSLSSVGASRRRRKTSGGFDPFSGGKSKGKGAGGFDPFEAQSKKSKKYKGGGGFDPMGNNSKRGRHSSSGGFDPFADNSKSSRSNGGGGTWANSNKRKLKVSSAGYADWDGSKARGGLKNRRGSANASWLNGSGGKGVAKGGGTWSEGSTGRSRHSRGEANDSWANENKHSSGKGGGIWAMGGVKNLFRSSRSSGGNSNWDHNDPKEGDPIAAPSYTRQDNVPKSYSDYENAGISSDLTYDAPHQYKYALIAGSTFDHTDGKKITNYLNGAAVRPVLGAEFAVEWPTVGSKNWHHYFNIPTTGLGFTYLNLGNDQKLGSAFAIYPYVDIPLIHRDAIDFNLEGGFGAACVTKWDKTSPSSTDSTINSPDYVPMFGSPINVFIKGGFNLVFRPVTEINNQSDDAWSHYSFVIGASMIHMSNGSFSSPNSGLNLLTGSVGVKYCPSVLTPVIRRSGEELPHFLTLDVMGTAGVREMYRLDTKKYPVGNFNLTLYYQAANIYRIGLGVDGFYDGAFGDTHRLSPGETSIYENLTYDRTKTESCVRGGVCLSNEFVLGRVTAAADGGYYVYDNIKAPGESVYFRFAMKYRFTSRVFGVVSLKTHKLNAEFVSFGLGYSLPL